MKDVGIFRRKHPEGTLKTVKIFEFFQANLFRIVSKLVGRSDRSSRCPGKRAGAEDKKGRD
jgi:hypothetical protein